MCKMNLVHFFTVEELVAEALRYDVGSKIVRLERIVKSRPAGTPGLANRESGIALRALVAGEIFSLWLRMGRIQTLHGEPFGPDAEIKADLLGDRAERWEKHLAEYLTAEGLTVRPGLIDIGGAEPVPAEWLGMADEWAAEKKLTKSELERRKGGSDGG